MNDEATGQGARPRSADHPRQGSDGFPGGLLKIYTTESLFGAANEIGIEHDGSLYRLKITRQRKLILNK